MEQQVQDKIKQLIKKHSNSIATHYCGDEADQIASVLNHYERLAASAIGEKKDMIDNTLVYFRSVVMLCESVGIAQTHGEKNARLRGLIELLNTAINKLKKDKTEDILSNWPGWDFSYADYPYRSIINKYNELKHENERLKQEIKKEDELPL